MHRNGPFILLLSAILLATGWFGIRATRALLAYTRLNTETEGVVEALELRQGKGDDYQIIATYMFESKEGTMHAVGSVGPIYKNPWSAQKALEGMDGKVLKVWYNSAKPGDCSLIKKFPTKITLSTTVLVGLVLYFIGLGLYVGGQRGTRA